MKFKSKYITSVGGEGLHVLNTGDWRSKRPVLNQELCIKCGTCFLYCPVNSIVKENGEFHINYSYCKGCGVCAHECSKKAIEMIPEVAK